MKYISIFLKLVVITGHLQAGPSQLTEKQLDLARQSIQALIRPLLPMKSKAPTLSGFRVDQCEKQTDIDWREVLLMRKEIVVEYKFTEGCDIQGTIRPKVFSPFPASLDLRNLQDFKKVVSENKITSSIERTPVMTVDILKGTLTDKVGKIDFEADYKVKINPLSKENFISENLGGEIRIKRIYGQKVSITKKIMIE